MQGAASRSKPMELPSEAKAKCHGAENPAGFCRKGGRLFRLLKEPKVIKTCQGVGGAVLGTIFAAFAG